MKKYFFVQRRRRFSSQREQVLNFTHVFESSEATRKQTETADERKKKNGWNALVGEENNVRRINSSECQNDQISLQ